MTPREATGRSLPGGAFSARQADLLERADVNYLAASAAVRARYAGARYPLVALGEVCQQLQYGISALATSEPVGFPMLRMNNLQEDGWDLTDVKYIQMPEKDASSYFLAPGDILFNRTNSKELVGKCAVFREEGRWVFASYLIRVRVIPEKAIPEFVSTFLLTSAGRAQIDRVSRQIIGMSNLNAAEIRDLLLPLPPLKFQQQLVRELEKAREATRRLLAEAAKAVPAASDSLLARLGLAMPAEQNQPVYAVRRGELLRRLDPYANLPRFRRILTALGKGVSARSNPFLCRSLPSGHGSLSPCPGGSSHATRPTPRSA